MELSDAKRCNSHLTHLTRAYNLAGSRVKYADMRTDLIKHRDDLTTKITATQIAEAQKTRAIMEATKWVHAAARNIPAFQPLPLPNCITGRYAR
jgi:hypothetical protein